jgi:hypothetical protein
MLHQPAPAALSPARPAPLRIVHCSFFVGWMPTLADIREPTLTIICAPCGRRGRYSVARLIEEHGDAMLPDLLVTLANCPKRRSANIYDRCKAVYLQSLPAAANPKSHPNRTRPARATLDERPHLDELLAVGATRRRAAL